MATSAKKPQITLNLPTEKPDPTRGGGAWSLRTDHVEEWAWLTGVFSDTELDTIIEIGSRTDLQKASTYGPIQDDRNRNSHVQFLFPNDVTGWIFERLAGAINAINDQYFKFELSAMEQGLQFTRYTAPGQHYHWHVDRGHRTAPRKLSVSVQLTDPKDYKGGDLELQFGRKPTRIARHRGMVTFFPSYTLHRVRPVTQGTRHSLVCWVSGPPFK